MQALAGSAFYCIDGWVLMALAESWQ
jgi:hypothetical protein